MTKTVIDKIKEWLEKASALLEQVVGFFRVKLAIFRKISPSVAPKMWIYINGTCCILTAMFFLLACIPNHATGHELASVFYIPFNLVICLVWLAEASLWILFDEESAAWHKLGEFVLATFFVADGIVWMFEMGEGPVRAIEMMIYTGIDFFIYLFYLVLAIREEAKKELREAAAEAQPSLQKMEQGEAIPTSSEKEYGTNFELMK